MPTGAVRGDLSIRDTRAVALEHWNGSTWKAVGPPFGKGQPILGVAATSASDAWAVGGYQHHGHSRTIAAHWDGERWAIAPTPNHNTDSALSDVVAECGFSDQSHFTRHFTRAVGVSPGTWRRAFKE